MDFLLKIKRRLFGAAGAPDILSGGELAYNEVDDNLYYGSNDGALKIAGKGNLVDRIDLYQNIIGDKNFSNTTRFSSVCAYTPNKENFDNQIVTTEYVKSFFNVIDGGFFDTNPLNYIRRCYFYPQTNNYWYNLDNWYTDYKHKQSYNLLPTNTNNVTIIGGTNINVNVDYFSWKTPVSINVGTGTIAFSSTNHANVSSNIVGNAVFNGNVTYNA
jgi:hypothetical protein